MVIHEDELLVILYGTPVAHVRRGRAPHRLRWTWTPEASARWGVGSRVVSHGLAISQPGSEAADLRAGVFANGLLPEGDARLHYAVNAGIDPDDTFGLLRRYARDTAGALEFLPRDSDDSSAPTPGPLSPPELRRLLEDAGSSSRHGGLTSVSLAGLVPKIALVRDGDAWRQPAAGEPSTWILKVAHPPSSQAADVVDTEVACLDLGRRVGITTVDAEIVDTDGQRAIAVSRYDRRRGEDGNIERLHQEDLAQALGLNTAQPDRKFQHGRAIPSWSAAADVLGAGSGSLSLLARLVTFSYLVGNTDHHAKNTSFLRRADGTVSLAPGYDIAAHLHYPGAHRTALDLAGESDFAVLSIEHVVEEIESWGIPGQLARNVVIDTTTRLADALASIDRARHPGVTAAAWNLVDDRVAEAAETLYR